MWLLEVVGRALSTSKLLLNPWIIIITIFISHWENGVANEVIGCGGFLKSEVELDFSRVEIRLLSKQGSVKDKTDCSPSNGYYFIPVYDKGDYVLQVAPPSGWSFEPSEVSLRFDGKTDICSQSKDINFRFQGFGITGQIRFANTGTGASGVDISLRSLDDVNQLSSRHTITDSKGVFSFTPIVPGNYRIQASHPHWYFRHNVHQVTVTKGNTELTADHFVVTGFDLLGHFHSSVQQQLDLKNVAVALLAKKGSPIAKCQVDNGATPSMKKIKHEENSVFMEDTLCYAFAQTTGGGEYMLPNVAPGTYLLVPTTVLDGQVTNLRWSPRHLQVEILDNFQRITTEFQIEGFDVRGQILTAPGGIGVSGATIKLEGKPMATTDAKGTFLLANIKSGGWYSLQVEAPRLKFNEQRVKLEMSKAILSPAVVPSSLEVCGRVEAKNSHEVAIIGVDNSAFRNTLRTEEETGVWCTFLAPGKYRISVLKDTDKELKQSSVQFSPLEETINVVDAPLQVRPFTQLRVKIQGRLKCLPDAPYSSCLGTEVTLTHLDTSTGSRPITQLVKDGHYTFENVLPGFYEIALTSRSAKLCFKSLRQELSVSSALETVPDFVQTGYEIEMLSSHDTLVKYSHSTEAGVGQQLKITTGLNRFCVPRMGVYNFQLESCHLYDEKLVPKSFSTMDKSDGGKIQLEAIAHEIGIRVLTMEPIANGSNLQLQLESTNLGKRLVTPTLVKGEKVNGKLIYRYRMHLRPMETLQVTPFSDSLLFQPTTKKIIGANDCLETAMDFMAVRGLILKGRVVPIITEALITLRFPQNPELEPLTTITDKQGEFQFKPIPETINYQLIGEKESYVFEEFDRQSSIFKVHKLCKIVVGVRDDMGKELSGVLVSLSGGESYRKNLITGDDGTIYFPSLAPSEYFIRPMLKEYKFEPNSKVITVKDGETVDIRMSGKRIAYSVYGMVTSLNGSPLHQLTVEAVASSNESCSEHQEEATTEINGHYRLRGLKPDCEYEISLKTLHRSQANPHPNDHHSSNHGVSNEVSNFQLENTVPVRHLIRVQDGDVYDVNFLGLMQLSYVDVLVYVTVSSNDWYKSLRLLMYRKGGEDSPLYNQRVEGPLLNQKSDGSLISGSLISLPRIPLDQQIYVVELRSTLSDTTFKYKLPSAEFMATSSSVYLELAFQPELRSTDPDVTHGSLSALIMIALVVIVFFKQDFAFSAFWFLYDRVQQLIEEFLGQRPNRHNSSHNSKINGNNNNNNNNGGQNPKTNDLNPKEIEQIAEQINNMKKKKAKKL